MQSKNKKNWVKWMAVLLLLVLLSCSLNIFKTTKNSNSMTTRQKILKAAYPAMMWFTKVTGVNSKSITNKGVTSPESFYNLPATLIDDSAINLNQYKGKKISPLITALKRVSKPGLRVYANRKELPRVLGGLGVAVISTSQGVMTDTKARHQGLGGEVICYIW